MPNPIINRRLIAANSLGNGIWSPLDLTNLKMWVKSDAGLTLSGTNVSTWADQSGQGYDLQQNTDASRPSYVTNQLNGYPAIVFNGTSNFMSTINMGLTQPCTIFFIGKQITWSANGTFFDGTIDNSLRFHQYGVSPKIGQFSGAYGASTILLNVNKFALLTNIYNSSSSILQLNNNAESTGDPSVSLINGFVLGSYATGAIAFGNIAVCEIAIQSSVASTADRDAMKNYIRLKYGLPT